MSSEKSIVLILFGIITTATIQSTPYDVSKPSMISRMTVKFDQNKNVTLEEKIKRKPKSRPWVTREFLGHEDITKMHAFVVRDENIPPCCSTIQPTSNTHHFMCSGAVLTPRHAITSASCMHFADVYEHHINAELAILVGAFSSMSHSIKINRFEMHPNYDYDVDSNDLSTFNLAILFLNCSISLSNVIIPRLPMSVYDDIGHLCCGEKCELMTIIQNGDYHHVARILLAKYLPSPMHDSHHQTTIIANDASADYRSNHFAKTIYELNSKLPIASSITQRVKKSPGKLAEAPRFFFKSSKDGTTQVSSKAMAGSSEIVEQREIQKNLDGEREGRRKIIDKSKKVDKLSMRKNVNVNGPNFQNVGKNRTQFNEEALTKIDWKIIEEKLGSTISNINREKMEKFTKKLVDVTMKRVDSVVDVNNTTLDNSEAHNNENNQDKYVVNPNFNFLRTFLPYTQSNHENRSLNDFAIAFANILKTVAVPPDNGNKLIVSSDLIVDENDLNLPPPKYVKCPPLGTPVFKNRVLYSDNFFTLLKDVVNFEHNSIMISLQHCIGTITIKITSSFSKKKLHLHRVFFQIAMIAYTCDDVQNWVEWKYVSISKNIKWIQKRIMVMAGSEGSQQSSFSCDESHSIPSI